MKKFIGFTPEQQFKLLSTLGYSGPKDVTEMENFIKASPGVSAQMGKYAETAQNRLMDQAHMATGGYVDPTYSGFESNDPRSGNTTTQSTSSSSSSSTPATSTSTNSNTTNIGGFVGKLFGGLDGTKDGQLTLTAPSNSSTSSSSSSSKKKNKTTGGSVADGATNNTVEDTSPFANVLTQDSVDTTLSSANTATTNTLSDPSSYVTTPKAATVNVQGNQFIDPATGQIANVTQGNTSTVTNTQVAGAPQVVNPATYQASTAAGQVDSALTNVQAATADPTAKATVRGQLELLMDDFETDGTPPWASAAMREATQVMQKRGLGASSLAGQAILSATMEAALPIAMADAQTHATFELQNLSNEQQTGLLKTQFRVSSILSDAAADNAAKQFNASSENQVNTFMADLESTVSRFNATQVNAMLQFNAGEKNAMEKFNKTLEAERDKFNANSSLVIAQANAQWRQSIATTNTQIEHDTNMESAKAANGLTSMALDNIWQKERDIMAFAYQSAENEDDRALKLALGDQADRSANAQGMGYILGKIVLGGLGLG